MFIVSEAMIENGGAGGAGIKRAELMYVNHA
jgi:hypothetical protein